MNSQSNQVEVQVNITNSASDKSNWGYSTQQFIDEPVETGRIVHINASTGEERVIAPACRISTNIEDPYFNSWE